MDPEELYSEIEAELAPVKRGRGRPKGSKNKPKALPEPEPEEVPEAAEDLREAAALAN